MKKVLRGGMDLGGFILNEPSTGEMAVDMAAIYQYHQLPKCIIALMREVDWSWHRRLVDEEPSDAYRNAIFLFQQHGKLPGGLGLGRLLWDIEAPTWCEMPVFLREDQPVTFSSLLEKA